MRDAGVYAFMLIMTPFFLLVFGLALLLTAPVLLPLWLWDRWKKGRLTSMRDW